MQAMFEQAEAYLHQLQGHVSRPMGARDAASPCTWTLKERGLREQLCALFDQALRVIVRQAGAALFPPSPGLAAPSCSRGAPQSMVGEACREEERQGLEAGVRWLRDACRRFHRSAGECGCRLTCQILCVM